MKDNFKRELLEKAPEILISSWMIERIPHLFGNDSHSYINWKHLLSERIGVDSASILFVGSSAVGLSLNPNKTINYSIRNPILM